MITINGKYKIPSEWFELRPYQYLKICEAVTDFLRGKRDFEAFKLQVLMILLDIESKKIKNLSETFCENLWRIGEQINFYYMFVYEDDRYKKLSPATQEKLLKTIPKADDSEPEMRIASQFKYRIKIDLHFGEQLLPFLDSMRLIGYKFHYANGLVDTSLTAAQYTDANSLVSLFYKSKDERALILDKLVRVLYCPEPYSQAAAEKVGLQNISQYEKVAVLYNYNAIIDWISDIEKYKYVFHGAKTSEKNLIGPNSPIYQLAGKGYGSVGEIEKMSLFNYLDLLLKETIDSVNQLGCTEMKHGEIAESTGLMEEQVDEILNNTKR